MTNQLWALCFASIPLSLIALALGAFVRRAAVAVLFGVAVLGGSVLVLKLVFSGAPGSWPPALEAWGPNLVILTIACTLLRRARAPRGVRS